MKKVIAVFSPSGGTGVSTIAAHLAYKFADTTETAIVDMHPDFGNIGKILNFSASLPQDKFPVAFKIDSQFVSDLTVPQQIRLKYFPAPPSTVSDPQDWKNHIANCQRIFPITILDLPSTFLVPELQIGLDMADLVLLVTEYHWSKIVNVKSFLDCAHDEVRVKCKILMNKTVWLPKVVIDECNSNLGQEIFHTLPNDTALEGVQKLKLNTRFGTALKALTTNLTTELQNS